MKGERFIEKTMRIIPHINIILFAVLGTLVICHIASPGFAIFDKPASLVFLSLFALSSLFDGVIMLLNGHIVRKKAENAEKNGDGGENG